MIRSPSLVVKFHRKAALLTMQFNQTLVLIARTACVVLALCERRFTYSHKTDTVFCQHQLRL